MCLLQDSRNDGLAMKESQCLHVLQKLAGWGDGTWHVLSSGGEEEMFSIQVPKAMVHQLKLECSWSEYVPEKELTGLRAPRPMLTSLRCYVVRHKAMWSSRYGK